MTEPVGDKNISPQLQETYRNEYARGVTLFKNSLTEHQKAEDGPKKDKFKDVMDKALNIMNESARGFLSTKGQADQKVLQQDYQTYLANHDANSYQKLNKDIDNIKHYT